MSVAKSAPVVAAWRVALEASSKIERLSRRVTGTRHGGADVFAYLFRARPSFVEDGAPADWMVAGLQAQKGIEAVRGASALSVIGSLAALVTLLDEAAKQPQQQKQDAKNQQPGAGEGEGAGEGAGEGEGEGEQQQQPPGGAGEGRTLDKLGAVAMRRARDAAAMGREIESACGMLAGSETAPLGADPAALADALAACDRLAGIGAGVLRKLLDTLGALERLADAERRAAPIGGAGVPRGLGRGGVDAVARATSDEALRLAGELGPELADDSLARAIDGRLAIVEGGGDSPSGLGPILLAIDRSGSMKGDRQTAAAALAMTLQRRAMQERRLFRYVLFDTEIVGAGSTTGAGRWRRPSDAVGVAAWAADGGTDFNAAFGWFARQLREERGAVPDCVLLTDGLSQVGNKLAVEFARIADERGARLLTLVIGWAGGWPAFASEVPDVAALTDEGFASPEPTADSMAAAVRRMATAGDRRGVAGKLAAIRRAIEARDLQKKGG